MRKRLDEQRLAASGRHAAPARQAALRCDPRVGKKLDVLDVGNHGVENDGRWFRPAKLIDDHVAYKHTQRRLTAVVPVRAQKPCTPQTRDGQRIEHVIIGRRIEDSARRIKIAVTRRQTGNEEGGIGGAVDVTGAATDAGATRHVAEHIGRTESEVAEVDQIGFAGGLTLEDFTWFLQRVLIEFRPIRQYRLAAVDGKRLQTGQRC